MPDYVDIIEVSPRDGIQNEAKILSTETKLALIRRALDAGLKRIEVTSFVNPARVPQMADADAVAAGLPQDPKAVFTGLTLNQRGVERAAKAKLKEINVVIVASDTFSRRNQGMTTQGSIDVFASIMKTVRPDIRISLTIGAAFGCPFEGEISLSRLLSVAEAAIVQKPFELALADTIGVATPKNVTARVAAIARNFPGTPIRLHLHNTRNTGIANAWAGLEAGAVSLDSSLGGSGGCPFAPRATGNIATEDLVYMLERSGVETGVDLDKAIAAAEWLEANLGAPMPGMVMKAGGFPGPKAA